MTTNNKTVPGGLFITLEGLESAGKSTQLQLLKTALVIEGYDVVTCGEPGGTHYGQMARKLFLEHHQDLVPEAEVGLLLTCKIQLLREVIEPALAAGKIVICDRYTDTLFAYQHHAKGHDRATMKNLLLAFNANRTPDLTLLLDIPAELSVRRSLARKNQGGDYSSFDAAAVEFHEKVAKGLKSEIGIQADGLIIQRGLRGIGHIDGTQNEEAVFHDCLARVMDYLNPLGRMTSTDSALKVA